MDGALHSLFQELDKNGAGGWEDEVRVGVTYPTCCPRRSIRTAGGIEFDFFIRYSCFKFFIFVLPKILLRLQALGLEDKMRCDKRRWVEPKL